MSYQSPAPEADASLKVSPGATFDARHRSQLPTKKPEQPSEGEGRSLGYIKPSDLKPSLQFPALQQAEKEVKGESIALQSKEDARTEPPRDGSRSPSRSGLIPIDGKEPAAPRKIIIRSGDMEFEVESFDSAVAAATRLVTGIEGGLLSPRSTAKNSLTAR